MTFEYRKSIYSDYATTMKGHGAVVPPAELRRWGRAYAYYLRGWVPDRRDANILEVGCGAGHLLHLLQARGYKNVTGVDISPSQVALARQAGFHVEEADALRYLAGQAARYDLIVALDVIEHMGKEEGLKFLQLAHAALVPGGRLILQTPNADSPWFGSVRYGDLTHELAFTAELLAKVAIRCGFGKVEIREQGPPARYYGPGASVRYVLWRVIRLGMAACSRIETGWAPQALTRVFLFSALRQDGPGVRRDAEGGVGGGAP